jgi:hypothetical protein
MFMALKVIFYKYSPSMVDIAVKLLPGKTIKKKHHQAYKFSPPKIDHNMTIIPKNGREQSASIILSASLHAYYERGIAIAYNGKLCYTYEKNHTTLPPIKLLFYTGTCTEFNT